MCICHCVFEVHQGNDDSLAAGGWEIHFSPQWSLTPTFSRTKLNFSFSAKQLDFFIYRWLFVQLDLLIRLFENGDLQKNIKVYCATQQRSKLFVQHWYQFNQGWSKKHWNCSDCIIACNAQEIPVCNACIMRLNIFSC